MHSAVITHSLPSTIIMMMILCALIYVISVSSIIALRSIIPSPKLPLLTNSLGDRLASKHSSSLGDGDSDVPEILKEKLQLDLSQLKPFLKIAVPFFREDKPARDSVSLRYHKRIFFT